MGEWEAAVWFGCACVRLKGLPSFLLPGSRGGQRRILFLCFPGVRAAGATRRPWTPELGRGLHANSGVVGLLKSTDYTVWRETFTEHLLTG